MDDSIKSENLQYRRTVSEAAATARVGSYRENPELVAVYENLFNALMYLVDKNIGKKLNIETESQSLRVGLCAQFVSGIEFCHTSIIGGFYTQASVLIKQEMEIVAAIKECEVGVRKNKRTPNVRHLNELARIYDILNDIGHVSVDNIVAHMVSKEIESGVGASLYPVYKSDLFIKFYFWHSFILVEFFLAYDRLCNEIKIHIIDNEMELRIQAALTHLNSVVVKV